MKRRLPGHVGSVSGSVLAKGFTLLELVIVLFIIGVVFTSALMVLPLDHADRVNLEIKTFARRIAQVREQAVFDSRPYGLGVWRSGYDFFAWHPDKGWIRMRDGRLVSSAELETLQVSAVTVAGTRIGVETNPVSIPQVVFSPSGEVMSLDVRLSAFSRGEYRLFINAQGEVDFAPW